MVKKLLCNGKVDPIGVSTSKIKLSVIVEGENVIKTAFMVYGGKDANDCANSYQTTIILKDRNIVAPVDDGVCIGVGCKKFVEMIETEKMPESYEDMIFPVYIIEKIIESYTLNKRVVI